MCYQVMSQKFTYDGEGVSLLFRNVDVFVCAKNFFLTFWNYPFPLSISSVMFLFHMIFSFEISQHRQNLTPPAKMHVSAFH